MPNICVPFQPGNFYHVYNHATGDDSLFTEDRNYPYFLMLYSKHIAPVASTFAFCLMPNHLPAETAVQAGFHFVVRINDEEKLVEYFNRLPVKNPKGFSKPLGFKQLENKIAHQFGNLQNAYTKAFNKVNNRKGQLFCQSIQRKKLDSDEYIINAIRYIHFNPQSHNFVKCPDEWRFSSYDAYLENKPTKISRNEGMAKFKNKQGFINLHQDDKGLSKYATDMDLYY